MKKHLISLFILFGINNIITANTIVLSHTMDSHSFGVDVNVNISKARAFSYVEVCLEEVPHLGKKCETTRVNNDGVGSLTIKSRFNETPTYCELIIEEKTVRGKMIAYYAPDRKPDYNDGSEPIYFNPSSLYLRSDGDRCNLINISQAQLNDGRACVTYIKLNSMYMAAHNNDCKRLQGNVNLELVNTRTGKVYPLHSGGSAILSYSGSKIKDFVVRNPVNASGEVAFRVDSESLDANLVELRIKGNRLKGCHKGCDLCTDYHCKVRYRNDSKSIFPSQTKVTADLISADDHKITLNFSINYLRKLAEDSNQKLITIVASNMKTDVHNNDCNRHQGSIRVYLRNRSTNEVVTAADGNNILLNWSGNKSRDFTVRDVKKAPWSKLRFYIDERAYNDRNYSIEVNARDLRSCHKGCDLCSDYNCNLRYDRVNVFPNEFRGNTARVNLNTTGRDDHTISFDLKVE